MDILTRLKQLMKEYGWSEYRLAKKANLSQSTIANIFKRNSAPNFATLDAICRAFDITFTQFFSNGEEIEGLSEEQKILLANWNDLTKEQKDTLFRLIRLIKGRKL